MIVLLVIGFELYLFGVDVVHDVLGILEHDLGLVDGLAGVTITYGPQQSQDLLDAVFTRLAVMKIWLICSSKLS